MSTSSEMTQKVIKVTQELLAEESGEFRITPELIAKKLEIVLSLNPKWASGVSRSSVTDELIRRFSVWIGDDTQLTSAAGHEAWLDASRKKDWRYWQRYSEWLERKISATAVDALGRSTDLVLSLLEDPLRPGPWNRRGLVVGHVQSGKTSHYTGVICKAADAGYKIIIVLAGLHNNLRAQTQIRLDEGFLGFETRPDADLHSPVGVGEIDSDPAIAPNYATNRSEKGDFSTAIARNLGISPEQRPWLFVVKKNRSVLEQLLKWVRNHVADVTDPSTGRKLVTQFPLLLVDDEADNASVDTKEQVFDEAGTPDPEHEPTAINSRIRKILSSFTRAAYVGYTATPFANIFIHERGETAQEGPDLFPSSFIVNLAAPSNYIGPQKVFGIPSPDGRKGGLPLIRRINDFADPSGKSGWMPSKHRNGHVPLHEGRDEIPPSLAEAIAAFIIACAVRNLRGHRGEHSSMLIHVTRFNSVQQEVYRQVEEYVRRLTQRISRSINSDQIETRMRELYERDFVPSSSALAQAGVCTERMPAWDHVWREISGSIQDIHIRMINGTAKDVLDYTDRRQVGLKVIAIGGDKLARGLTLEGLCVSYFLRASRMYDTLMQMGRWFGYRPGYLDLCRLYTTEELAIWFAHIADASEELREEFEIMAATGATPREYGLKVQSHPVLLVTSRLKMRAARDLLLSFSGELLETVTLHRSQAVLKANRETMQALLHSLGAPDERDPIRSRGGPEQRWKGFLWRSGSADQIIDFLSEFKTHPEAYKVRSELLAEFIRAMKGVGELTTWSVALIGGGEGAPFVLQEGIAVNMLRRSHSSDHTDRYSIGRLLSPRDESIDADEATWLAALKLTRDAWRPDPVRDSSRPPDQPSGTALRRIRGFGDIEVKASPERGLLLLYLLDPQLAGCGFPDGSEPVVAFGISFPGSSGGQKVLYKVNSVQWHQWEREYGSSE